MGEEKGLVAAILEARVQLQLAPLPALCLSWGRGIASAGARVRDCERSEGAKVENGLNGETSDMETWRQTTQAPKKCTSTEAV